MFFNIYQLNIGFSSNSNIRQVWHLLKPQKIGKIKFETKSRVAKTYKITLTRKFSRAIN